MEFGFMINPVILQLEWLQWGTGFFDRKNERYISAYSLFLVSWHLWICSGILKKWDCGKILLLNFEKSKSQDKVMDKKIKLNKILFFKKRKRKRKNLTRSLFNCSFISSTSCLVALRKWFHFFCFIIRGLELFLLLPWLKFTDQ